MRDERVQHESVGGPMTAARLPHAPAFVGGCTVPEPRHIPLAQRVDLPALGAWNARNAAARAEYRRQPNHFGAWLA